jgi:DNA primase catalytic core
MAHFPREFVREVVDRTTVVDVVGRHVQLKRRGSAWVGLCPFHSEKSPSFYVNEARKNYHCFGCGEGGDAIAFVRKIEGLGFVEAVKDLAAKAGMEVPEEDLSPEQILALQRKEELHRANEVAAAFFAGVLDTEAGRAGREYLEQRGVPPELVERFRVGVAPDAWDGLRGELRRAGISEQGAVDAGLLVPRRGEGTYDRFRNRLIFPIRATNGKVVAFGGRTLGDDRAKYINSPETPVYNKSTTLYGLYEARASIQREDRAMVVEGYFDVMGLAQAEINFAVAPCGTALTDRQLSGLRRHSRNVILLFDADEAGRRAATKALPLCLKQGLRPSWLTVPEGKDPDDYVQEHGGEAMRALLDGLEPLLDVRIRELLSADIGPDETLAAIAELLWFLAPAEQRKWHRTLDGALNVDGRVIDAAIKAARPRQIGSEVSLVSTRARALREQPTFREADGPLGAAPLAPPPGDDERPPDEPDDEREPATPVRPRRPPTSPQLELLRLLVQDAANVAPYIEEHGVMSWVRHPEVEVVAGRILRCWRAGTEPRHHILDGVVSTEVLHTVNRDLVSQDQWFDETTLQNSTIACVLGLNLEWLDHRRGRMARELSVLEHAPKVDMDRIRDLAVELRSLHDDRCQVENELRNHRF